MHERFAQGLIDDPRNLSTTPVLLFSGKNDWVVWTSVMRETRQQLASFVPPTLLATNFATRASHVWSIDGGSSCSCGACPLEIGSTLCCDVNDCAYDLTGETLRHFYGESVRPRVRARLGGLRWVDQWAHLPPSAEPRGNASTLLRWGLAYVPAACEGPASARCRVHVNYHGCTKNSWPERLVWARSIHLNEYAEANALLVVYPQAAGSVSSGEGCFNWASYEDDPLFDTARGVQLQTVSRLVADLDLVLSKGEAFPVGPGGMPPAPGLDDVGASRVS